MAKLVGLNEYLIGKEFPLNQDKTMIGRDPGNNILVDNGSVSGNHCFIRAQKDGGFSIQDLSSTNGIAVNCTAVDFRELNPDDMIEVGTLLFRLELEPGDKAPERAPVIETPEPDAGIPILFGASSPTTPTTPTTHHPSAAITAPLLAADSDAVPKTAAPGNPFYGLILVGGWLLFALLFFIYLNKVLH